MAKRKPQQILTHAVVAGKRYKIAANSKDSREIQARIDDHVEVVDSKLKTGVVDITVGLFADINWSKAQSSTALKQAKAKGVDLVTLEFLAAA